MKKITLIATVLLLCIIPCVVFSACTKTTPAIEEEIKENENVREKIQSYVEKGSLVAVNENEVLLFNVIGIELGTNSFENFYTTFSKNLNSLDLAKEFLGIVGKVNSAQLDMLAGLFDIMLDYYLYNDIALIEELFYNNSTFSLLEVTDSTSKINKLCTSCTPTTPKPYTLTEFEEKFVLAEQSDSNNCIFNIKKLSDFTFAINIGEVWDAWHQMRTENKDYENLLYLGNDSAFHFFKSKVIAVFEELDCNFILKTTTLG